VKAFHTDSPGTELLVKGVVEYRQQPCHGVHPSVNVVTGYQPAVSYATVLERGMVLVCVTVELQHMQCLNGRREAVEPLVVVCKHGGVVVAELLFSFRVEFLLLVLRYDLRPVERVDEYLVSLSDNFTAFVSVLCFRLLDFFK
jgi:hypothetical protein